jgi:hypothetical protein
MGKLTEADREAIRAKRAATGLPYRVIGEEFGVSGATVSDVINGRAARSDAKKPKGKRRAKSPPAKGARGRKVNKADAVNTEPTPEPAQQQLPLPDVNGDPPELLDELVRLMQRARKTAEEAQAGGERARADTLLLAALKLYAQQQPSEDAGDGVYVSGADIGDLAAKVRHRLMNYAARAGERYVALQAAAEGLLRAVDGEMAPEVGGALKTWLGGHLEALRAATAPLPAEELEEDAPS